MVQEIEDKSLHLSKFGFLTWEAAVKVAVTVVSIELSSN